MGAKPLRYVLWTTVMLLLQLALSQSIEAEGPRPESTFFGSLIDDSLEGLGGLKRSVLGRAEDGVQALANNQPQNLNIEAGKTQRWTVPLSVIQGALTPPGPGLPGGFGGFGDDELFERSELRKRQQSRQLYITINTCLVPSSNSSKVADPLPLQLFVTNSSTNRQPGPGSNDLNQVNTTLDEGYGNLTITSDGDVSISVLAPPGVGEYNYEIAASIDRPYHYYNDSMGLFLVDSDTVGALLITANLTDAEPESAIYQQWANMKNAPFGLFVDAVDKAAVRGLKKSYCGLKNNAMINPKSNLDSLARDMTVRGLGHKPKQQFSLSELSKATIYFGIMALDGNSTASGPGVPGGGGTVWKATNFTTKTDGNCEIIYDLEFCSEVAYAVPSNPKKLNRTQLTSFYDDNAKGLYQNFSKSLQQIACDTVSNAQYSLARTCHDCEVAYKSWLCAVTIPRCEDFSQTEDFLAIRNVAQNFIDGSAAPNSSNVNMWQNSSRNPLIDSTVEPGPYKEVLPCKDLCYDLVQSCPSALGFGCPLPGKGLERSYGERSKDGFISCSFLGAAYYLNAAPSLSWTSFWWAATLAASVILSV